MTKQVKEIYDTIKERQEAKPWTVWNDFDRGYFAALSWALTVINDKSRPKPKKAK